MEETEKKSVGFACRLLHAGFLSGLFITPEYANIEEIFLPKRRLTFNGLPGVMSHRQNCSL
jgi:hypothetical protein